ncbi:MAG TPA: ECF-type sigma factor [Candidatus Acidoferrales bacterium]|nr:ECF-type sigma factor [Candidatus Acidoferrales bacterium]
MSAWGNRQKDGPAELSEDRHTIDSLFSLTYEELRRFASRARRDGAVTLSSSGLVHEAWLRLKDSPRFASVSVPHFKAVAAKAMRRILIDEARRRNARKRGGGEAFVPLDGAAQQMISCQDELLDLDAALDELERVSPRQARMIEIRFFSGLDVSETAEVLGVSESAMERDWRAAKAWLAGRIRPHTAQPGTE